MEAYASDEARGNKEGGKQAVKQLKMLFSPIKIGTMEVRNRTVMPAMATNFAAPDGSPSDRQINYYAARAKGGAGIISTGCTEIDPRGKGTASSPAIWDEGLIPAWKKFDDAMHVHGARMVQLLHKQTSRQQISSKQG